MSLQWCPARRPGCSWAEFGARQIVLQLQWCPARRPGCSDGADRGSSAGDGLQWCPARRPGCSPKARTAASGRTGCFNGARPEGQDAGCRWSPAHRWIPRFNGARPEGQDAARGSCWANGRSARFNGARPEGQDAGRVDGRHVPERVHASMVPGPKARMRVAGQPIDRTRIRCFNGARPEGQDAGCIDVERPASAVELQWCPARRPGCGRTPDTASTSRRSASMVPGPKARMRGSPGPGRP